MSAKPDSQAVHLDELNQALPGHLLGIAEDYQLLEFLQKSPRRSVYLRSAENALRDLTTLLNGRAPDFNTWRARVAPGLPDCPDVRKHVRGSFGQLGHLVLRGRVEIDDLGLALAGTIIGVYLSEQGMNNGE